MNKVTAGQTWDAAWQVDPSNLLISPNEELGRYVSKDAAEVGKTALPLAELFTCKQTQHLILALLGRIRFQNKTVEIPYRRDEPDKRRWMMMRIEPAHGGQEVIFRSRIIKEEPRQPMPLLMNHLPRTEETVDVCPWCNRVCSSNGWLEIEDAHEQLGLHEATALPQLSHRLCDQCQATVVTAAFTS